MPKYGAYAQRGYGEVRPGSSLTTQMGNAPERRSSSDSVSRPGLPFCVNVHSFYGNVMSTHRGINWSLQA